MANKKEVAKKMTSHEAVREWKKTGIKPKGLKKVAFEAMEKAYASRGKNVPLRYQVGSDEHYQAWKKKVGSKSALSKAIVSLAKRKSNEA